jgi:hypothetical protein
MTPTARAVRLIIPWKFTINYYSPPTIASAFFEHIYSRRWTRDEVLNGCINGQYHNFIDKTWIRS